VARLPLGKEKKTVVVSFRITKEEADELTAKYGHYNRGVQAIYKASKEVKK
jgi:hypothetical protein